MKSHLKSSISSRATVRSLIVACLPAAAVALAANSTALGAAISEATHTGLSVDDNSVPSTNGPTTNAGTGHNNDTNSTQQIICIQGVRR